MKLHNIGPAALSLSQNIFFFILPNTRKLNLWAGKPSG